MNNLLYFSCIDTRNKLALKTTEEDEDETQEAVPHLAAAKAISVDGAIAAILT